MKKLFDLLFEIENCISLSQIVSMSYNLARRQVSFGQIVSLMSGHVEKFFIRSVVQKKERGIFPNGVKWYGMVWYEMLH